MLKKTLTIFFLIGVAGFIVLSFALQTEAARSYAKKNLAEAILTKTGYRVAIEDIRLYPTFHVKILNGALYDNEQRQLAFEELYVGLYPLEWLRNTLHLSTLEVDGLSVAPSDKSGSSFSLGDIPFKVAVDRVQIRYLAQDTIWNISGDLAIDPEEVDLNSHFHLFSEEKPRQAISGEITLEGGQGTFIVHGPSDTTVEGECHLAPDTTLTIPKFIATSSIFSLEGSLTLTPSGTITDGHLTFGSGDLSAILPVAGQLQGSGAITGPLLSPELDLSLKSDTIESAGNTFNNIKLALITRQTAQGLQGQGTLSFENHGEAHSFSGKILWDENAGGHLRASTDFDQIAQLLGVDFSDMEGRVDLDFTLSPTGVAAHAEISEGVFESYDFGTLLTDVRAILEGDLHTITLKEITAKDGNGGKLTGHGTCRLDPEAGFPLDIAFDIDNVTLVQLDNVKGVASGHFTLVGPCAAPKLSGEATANSIKIKLPERSTSLGESLEITYINQPTGAEAPTLGQKKGGPWPVEFDIKLKVPGEAKAKGRGLSSEWKGEVAVTGTPAALLVHGELKIVEGKYTTRGKTFRLTQGTVTVAGDPQKKASLYVIAEIKIDRNVIEVIVKGPINNPAISFRSNPPMSKKEILSWLLFNRGISDISPFQGTQLNESITMLASEPDGGPDIMSRVTKSLGLDKIDIGTSPGNDSGDVTVQVGKYLNDSTYVSFKRKSGGNSSSTAQTGDANCVGIETALGKHFSLEAEVDDDSGGQVNLLWKNDY